jgi:hypothetical protein
VTVQPGPVGLRVDAQVPCEFTGTELWVFVGKQPAFRSNIKAHEMKALPLVTLNSQTPYVLLEINETI